MRQPNALALLAEFIGHAVHAKIPCGAEGGAELEDAAIGDHDRIEAAALQQLEHPRRRLTVAPTAQLQQRLVLAARVEVERLPLPRVLHVDPIELLQRGFQLRREGGAPGACEVVPANVRPEAAQRARQVGLLPAQVESVGRLHPAAVGGVGQVHLVPGSGQQQ